LPILNENESAAPEADMPKWANPFRPKSCTVVCNPGFMTVILTCRHYLQKQTVPYRPFGEHCFWDSQH